MNKDIRNLIDALQIETLDKKNAISQIIQLIESLDDLGELVEEAEYFLNSKYELLDNYARAKLCYAIARSFFLISKMDEAEGFALRGVEIVKYVKEEADFENVNFLVTILYNLLANIAAINGNMFDCVNYYSEAYEKAIFLKDSELESLILNNIGVEYFVLQENEKTLTLFQKTIDNLPQDISICSVQVQSIYAVAMLNSALIYLKTGKGDEAKKLYAQYIEIIERNSEVYSNFKSRSLFVEVLILHHENRYDRADELFDTLFDLILGRCDSNEACEMFLSYADVYLGRENPDYLKLKSLRLRGDSLFSKTKHQHLISSLKYFDLRLSVLMNEKEDFENALKSYECSAVDSYNYYIREQGNATYDQYEAMLLKKERDNVNAIKIEKNYEKNMINIKKKNYKKTFNNINYVNKIAYASRKNSNFEENIEEISGLLKEKIEFDVMIVYSVDNIKNIMQYIYVNHGEANIFKEVPEHKKCQLIEKYTSAREIKIWDKNHLDKDYKMPEILKGANFLITVPLIYGEDVIGTIAMYFKNEPEDIEIHFDILQLVSVNVAIALNSYRLENIIRVNKEKLKKTKNKIQKSTDLIGGKTLLDSVTKLPSRRHFDLSILPLIRSCIENQLIMNLAIFQIDDFTLYNEKNGRLNGDELLKNIAFSLSDYFEFELAKKRNCDYILARYSGKKFILTFREIASKNIYEIYEQFLATHSTHLSLAFSTFVPNSVAEFNASLHFANSSLINKKENNIIISCENYESI